MKHKAESEYTMFKEGLYNKHLPKLCTIAGAVFPRTILEVTDPQIRASLSIQYSKAIDRAKYEVNNVLTTAAAQHREDSRRELNGFLSQIWSTQKTLQDRGQLSTSRLQLIEHRQKNVADFANYLHSRRIDFYIDIPIVILRHFPL